MEEDARTAALDNIYHDLSVASLAVVMVVQPYLEELSSGLEFW